MQAVRFHETGDAAVLRVEQIDRPEPGVGEVLVRVAASAFNPADGGMRGGFLPIPITLPHTPGYDVSGTIEALGAGVTDLALGERVIAFLPMDADGAAAEFVVAPSDALVTAPARIPLTDAAGLPSVGLTAWQALFEAGRLEKGQRILINGAGGPVGGYAVQLAKNAGAVVIATASPRSASSITAAGADQIVDHMATTLLDAVTEPVDVLLNLAPMTAESFASLTPLVRDGGVVVSTTPRVPTPDDPQRNVRPETIFVHPDRDALAELVRLVDEGRLRVEIAEHVPLAELPDVHRRSDAGALYGKVVVVPAATSTQRSAASVA